MKRVSELSTARKYAKALFAANPKDLDNLRAVASVISANINFFNNPVVPQSSIVEVIGKLGVDKNLANLLVILWTNKNVDLFDHIVMIYEKLYKDANNIVDCEVISHEKLTEANLKAITEKVSKLTKKTIQLKNVVEPSILGGLILKLGDTIIDDSYLSKLNEIKYNLLEV
jgi:F-type H+-transporting ATPase subunit delta